VVGSDNSYGIDIFTAEHFAKVMIGLTSLATVVSIDPILGLLAKYFPKIANGNNADILVSQEGPQMSAAHTAHSDKAHHNLFTRRHSSICTKRR